MMSLIKYFIITLCLLSAAGIRHAQNNWLHAFGGFSNDELIDAEVDSNGDIVHVAILPEI